MVWDLDTLAKLGEFVGGSFVVLTLIYLGFEAHVAEVLQGPLIDPGRERDWRRFVSGESSPPDRAT